MEREYCFRFFTLTQLFMLMAYNSIATAPPSITTDQQSLIALRTHITSDPHNILANNWTMNTPVCSWIGVTCGSRHQRVTALTIPEMGLKGTIPPEIGNLSFLKNLNMSHNYFGGNLPQELVYLHRLRVMDLTRNNLTGEPPPSIFNMSSLQYLILRDNSLSGKLPIINGNCGSIELRLAGNGFQGQIPSTLHKCTQLQMLTLARNFFKGDIPAQISHLTELRKLLLGFNNLTGAIPQEIGRLKKLESLGLEFNQLTGALPATILNISSLTYLSISTNSLSGSLPQGFANLTSLRTLYLDYNKLAGILPQELAYMHELKHVTLEFNSFTGSIPPGIFNLTNLRDINLNYNQLSGTLPATETYNLPNLEALYLAKNNLQGQVLSSISNCTRLDTLEVSGNQFSGTIPSSLANLHRLRFLRLAQNHFTRDSSSRELSFFTSLTSCRYLEDLILITNPLNGTLPRSIGNFSGSLRVLRVSGCMIRGEIPNEIGNLSSVADFDVARNDLGGSIPETIRGLESVQMLQLDLNRLVGSFPDSVCTLHNMAYLYLTGNQVSGQIPECLGNNNSYLRELHLSSNILDSAIPNSLWNLSDLSKFDLSSNRLRGSLSVGIGNLRKAIVIDLSNNELSGSIPSNVGGLQEVINFSLAYNRFEGSIPESLNDMLSLERLDLSHNNLTGNIPISLESLKYLNYLNVSFNDLGGEIPSGGPFGNFTWESFMNNRDFCGSPRLNFPPCNVNSDRSSWRRKKLRIIILASLGGVAVTSFCMVMHIIVRWKKRNGTGYVTYSPSAAAHRRISYYELQQATNGFDENNLLGNGGFCVVYKGVLGDDSVVAVKVFNLEVEGALEIFNAECEILKNLRHRNLSKIITSCSTISFKALILEYMPNGSLDRWLHSPNQFLDIMQRLKIMMDVASALEYLHYGYSTGVVHCDLKPSNVLLDEDMVAHVSDFGLAKLLGAEDTSAHTGTLATIGYMAPEYGMEGTVSPKSDVYSYGIMLMEVFTSTRPSEEYFCGDLTMKSWVQNSLPNEVHQIVDAKLLDPREPNLTGKLKCLTSIFELSISCAAESPWERTNIRDVLSRLNKIKSDIGRG